MTRAILTLNAGSSSLKASIYPQADGALLAKALVENIGANPIASIKRADGFEFNVDPSRLSNHLDSIKLIIGSFEQLWPDLNIVAVGHRVVHGGDAYTTPVLVDDSVLAKLSQYSALAPLHQPHNLAGILAAMTAFPNVAQVACFDTAFHRNHPWVNDTFALPREFYDLGVRRYGFHGLSYEYVASELKRLRPDLAQGLVVIAHLGNGASMCALDKGQSIASTMGFSALDGLPMGTRCGQLDPGVILYLIEQQRMSIAELTETLYKKSGLLGLSGISNDMRSLQESNKIEAKEAIEYFVFRCQREVGAMAAALGGIDALIFCGGIGENSSYVRARICERLEWMGIAVDEQRNNGQSQVISPDGSKTAVMVLPTNEEQVIANAARSIVSRAVRERT